MIFNTGMKKVGRLNDSLLNPFTIEANIKAERQFYRASWRFASECPTFQSRGILGSFLNIIDPRINQSFRHCSIDSRISMLMPGWYPCIPGWHCDDFYRPTWEQPDLENVLEKAPAQHFMVAVGETSFTEYISDPLNAPTFKIGELYNGTKVEKLYSAYDQHINSLRPKTFQVENGEVLEFGPTDFHRGMPAGKRGWRIFIRATFSNHREPKNEIRPNSQVYLPNSEFGW